MSAVGNHLEELPESLGDLQQLQELELSGNRLRALPESIGRLGAYPLPLSRAGILPWPCIARGWRAKPIVHWQSPLKHALPLHATQIPSEATVTCAPVGLLRKLALNGNALAALPAGLGGLRALASLALQANDLTSLPASMSALAQLQDLNLSDNRLASLPEGALEALPALKALWLYGNELTQLPAGILRAPALRGRLYQDPYVTLLLALEVRSRGA